MFVIFMMLILQSDYLRKISLKMLTMEAKSQNTIAGSLVTSASTSGRNPMESGNVMLQMKSNFYHVTCVCY